MASLTAKSIRLVRTTLLKPQTREPMRNFTAFSAALFVAIVPAIQAQRIEVTVPAKQPLTGHLVLVFAKDAKTEPRNQLREDYESAQGFGVDVENLAPGTPIVVDAKTFGYPLSSLANLDA